MAVSLIWLWGWGGVRSGAEAASSSKAVEVLIIIPERSPRHGSVSDAADVFAPPEGSAARTTTVLHDGDMTIILHTDTPALSSR